MPITETWLEAHNRIEAAVRAHPLFPALVHRVARCERSWGRYGSHWHNYERNRYYTIGHPYEFADDIGKRTASANKVALAMAVTVFPTPWPHNKPTSTQWFYGDMAAKIYNVARDTVRRRVRA